MTTMVLHYSTNLLDSLKKVLRNFMLGWQLATQRHANITVAMHLVRAGEYSNFHEAKTALDMKAQEWYEENKNA